MDIMALIGLLGAAGLVAYGVWDGGTADNFISSSAVAITIGGTLAALMITFPMKVFVSIPKLLFKVFFSRPHNPQKYVVELMALSIDIKRNGMLNVERKIMTYKDAFMRKGVQLAADGANPKEVRHIMETELDYMVERHKSGVRFFEKGAVYAPGFGMLGTLTGLINMLMQADDPGGITNGMAAALVTAFYGLIMANIIFLPMGNKLRRKSDEEVLCKQIIIEGVISIMNEENPLQIQEKLISFIPPSMRSADKIKRKANKINREI